MSATLITGIFLRGIGKIFLYLRCKGGGEDSVETFDLFFSRVEVNLPHS